MISRMRISNQYTAVHGNSQVTFVKLHSPLVAIARLFLAMAALCMGSAVFGGCTISRTSDSQQESRPAYTAAEEGAGGVDRDAPGASATQDLAPPLAANAEFTRQPTAAPAAPSEPLSKLAAGPQPVATPLVSSHRVVAGDTLSQLAERYGVTVASLMRANDLTNPNLLDVGQIIALPAPPVDYTPAWRILPDSLLVRSISAKDFNIAAFIAARDGALKDLVVHLTQTRFDGSTQSGQYSSGEIIERVSLEYSVDPRILIAILEYTTGILTQHGLDEQTRLFPLRPPGEFNQARRAGLYNQLSWLADQLNQGYYGWKYRGETILELADGSRLYFDPDLNAGTVAVQNALAQLPSLPDWRQASGEAGIYQTYRNLFGDPHSQAHEIVPANLQQPKLTLPFPRGDVWLFTGGFHGGWGNGSAWSAVDFAPPQAAGQGGLCYTSSYPVTAVARGRIARLDEGVVILDLDEDSDEATGWSILYLHVDHNDLLQPGQLVEAGNILGYASCLGGFTTATHLHIARRYNGEWLPADCNRCPSGVNPPPFVMSSWKVVGLASQLYQGFMVHEVDNRSAVAEQGRYTAVNEISW